MSTASDIIRGHTDCIILAQLIKRDSYGYEINKSIQRISGNTYELKEATLYTAFKRLEDSGNIASYWGDQTTGARRKYYTITELGKKNFRSMVEEWDSVKILMDKLVSEVEENEG